MVTETSDIDTISNTPKIVRYAVRFFMARRGSNQIRLADIPKRAPNLVALYLRPRGTQTIGRRVPASMVVVPKRDLGDISKI